jgi:hypothetical protein
VLGDVAALQDEFADGKQEKNDKNGVEFGGEESVDHEQFSLSPAWFCVFHDLAGEFNSIAATQLIPLLDSARPEHLIHSVSDSRVNQHNEPAGD